MGMTSSSSYFFNFVSGQRHVSALPPSCFFFPLLVHGFFRFQIFYLKSSNPISEAFADPSCTKMKPIRHSRPLAFSRFTLVPFRLSWFSSGHPSICTHRQSVIVIAGISQAVPSYEWVCAHPLEIIPGRTSFAPRQVTTLSSYVLSPATLDPIA